MTGSMGKTSGGGASSLKTRARRLLAAAARGSTTIPVSAAPPTITVGAANVASTINGAAVTSGAQTHAPNSAKLSPYRTPNYTALSSRFVGNVVSANSDTQRIGGKGGGHIFGFDGQDFDVCLYGGGVSGGFNVVWTDLETGLRQIYSNTDVATASNDAYVKVDFGSRARRLVEVVWGDSVFTRGYNFRVTDTVWPGARPDEPRIATLGDSYLRASNVASVALGLSNRIFEALGCPGGYANGVGGSGYLIPVNSKTWRDRVVAGDFDASRIGDLDLLFVFGSVNDGAQTDAAVGAEVQLVVQELKARQPNAIIMVAGPQKTATYTASVGRISAMQAAVVAAAGGDPRISFIDNSPSGDAWQTGTGKTTATTGDGNNDYYIQSDGTHWNAAGEAYGGPRIAASIVARLKQLAA